MLNSFFVHSSLRTLWETTRAALISVSLVYGTIIGIRSSSLANVLTISTNRPLFVRDVFQCQLKRRERQRKRGERRHNIEWEDWTLKRNTQKGNQLETINSRLINRRSFVKKVRTLKNPAQLPVVQQMKAYQSERRDEVNVDQFSWKDLSKKRTSRPKDTCFGWRIKCVCPLIKKRPHLDNVFRKRLFIDSLILGHRESYN